MRRLMALLAAAALVAGAVLVRSALDGEPTAAPGGPSSTTPTDADLDDAVEDLSVLCSSELAAACQALASEVASVSVERPGRTFDRLTSADEIDKGFDVWLTSAPWPDMVATQRSADLARPLLGEATPLGARSPMVLVVDSDRSAVLATECGIDWSCVGDIAGEPWSAIGGRSAWGSLRPGHPAPTESTAGLLATSQIAASRLGGHTFASNDFTPAFRSWFARVEDSVPDHSPPVGTPLEQMLLTPAFYDIVGALEAEAVPLVAGSRLADRLDVVVPEPIVTADAVAVSALGSSAAADLATSVAISDSLAGSGWRIDGEPTGDTPAGVALPSDDQLPGPGVLLALVSEWSEVTS